MAESDWVERKEGLRARLWLDAGRLVEGTVDLAVVVCVHEPGHIEGTTICGCLCILTCIQRIQREHSKLLDPTPLEQTEHGKETVYLVFIVEHDVPPSQTSKTDYGY